MSFDHSSEAWQMHNESAMPDDERFEYRLRHDGPAYKGDEHDWWAVQYRDGPWTWSTTPRRFRSQREAEDYIAEQDAGDANTEH